MNASNSGLENMTLEELEQAVDRFIAADGPGTDDLPADEFFKLWTQFEAEKRRRIIEVKGEVIGGRVHLSVTSSTTPGVEAQDNEIYLPDGTRIILNLKAAYPV